MVARGRYGGCGTSIGVRTEGGCEGCGLQWNLLYRKYSWTGDVGGVWRAVITLTGVVVMMMSKGSLLRLPCALRTRM